METCPPGRGQPGHVSIPLWFLRNYNIETLVAGNKKFPYHYGSYATSKKEAEEAFDKLGFHTTMVLTQRDRTFQ